MSLIDYSHHKYWSHAVVVQGLGANVLALTRLEKPFMRFDGSMAQWQLEYRWLSKVCRNSESDEYVCVMGSECTYWKASEIQALRKKLHNKEEVNLFEHFKLYGG